MTWNGSSPVSDRGAHTQHAPAPAVSGQQPSVVSLRGREWRREPPVQRAEPNRGRLGSSGRAAGHEARSTKNGQSSHADDGSTGPSASSASAAVTGSTSAQHLPASRHSKPPQPVPTGCETRPRHARSSDFEAVPRPRHAASAAADAAASHRALDVPVLAIEGARTHAPAISTGVAAVFPAFRRAQPAAAPCTRGARRARRRRTSICQCATLCARMLNINTQNPVP